MVQVETKKNFVFDASPLFHLDVVCLFFPRKKYLCSFFSHKNKNKSIFLRQISLLTQNRSFLKNSVYVKKIFSYFIERKISEGEEGVP